MSSWPKAKLVYKSTSVNIIDVITEKKAFSRFDTESLWSVLVAHEYSLLKLG